MTDNIPDTTSEHVSLDSLQQELSEALSAAEENLSGWKRAQADLENFRKRMEAETAEWVTFGKQNAFVQLLPVLDSLQQALTYAPDIQDDKYNNWKIGLEGIVKQIDSTLKQVGIEKIEAVGKRFDPHFHEAVKEVEGEEDGIVVEQYQTGYMGNNKVIRPAQVVISKKSS